ncbi:MAG: hypothetical protein AB4372_00995 [Xenococcus sp. (in: cyanobacteria)]
MIISDLCVYEELNTHEQNEIEGSVGLAFAFYANSSGTTTGGAAGENDPVSDFAYAATSRGGTTAGVDRLFLFP